jgi:hypothetical protein
MCVREHVFDPQTYVMFKTSTCVSFITHVAGNKYLSGTDKFIVFMCLFGLCIDLYKSYVIFILLRQ